LAFSDRFKYALFCTQFLGHQLSAFCKSSQEAFLRLLEDEKILKLPHFSTKALARKSLKVGVAESI